MYQMHHLLRTTVAVLGLMISGISLSSRAATANVSVGSGGDRFAPVVTNINVGDRVLWTWAGNNHNVTSQTSAWTASPTQGTGTTFTNTFNSAGTFPYECTIHVSLGMTGAVVVAVANLPPTVSITNPTPGVIFLAPANVLIQASASDSDGSVTNVKFLVDANVLTNKASSPFAATTNNLAAGSHTLSAIASDNLGATATNSVNIIVDTPPSVTLTNPATATVFATPANVTLRASASDSDGSVTNVKFMVDANVLTNKAAAPFSAATNNLAVGSHTLSAIASDNNGVTATNTVTVSVVAPVSTALSTAKLSAGKFQFAYSGNSGLHYVIERSTNLLSPNWVPLITNQAGSGSINFTDSTATLSNGFYRVGRLPNPQ